MSAVAMPDEPTDGFVLPAPLPHRLEFTNLHNPEVNREFIAMMSTEDNADLARAIPMALATKDPVPADEDTRAPNGPTRPQRDEDDEIPKEHRGDLFSSEAASDAGWIVEGTRWKDVDGDELSIAYLEPVKRDGRTPRVIFGVNGERAAFPVAQVIAFLHALDDVDDAGEEYLKGDGAPA